MGLHGVAAHLLLLGELQRVGGGRVGHRTEGLHRRRAHVPGWDDSDNTDRHHPLWDLLRHERVAPAAGEGLVPLQRRNGHSQPAAQTRVLLLRLPNVPRARRRLQRQLRFSLCITDQRRLPVHRPAGRALPPGQSLQPGRGEQTCSPHVLSEPHTVSPLTFYAAALRGDSHKSIQSVCSVQSLGCSAGKQIEFLYYGKPARSGF